LQIASDPVRGFYITVQNSDVPKALAYVASQGYEPLDPSEVEPDFPTEDTTTIYLLDPEEVFDA
jgi:hypothetical protein